MTTATPTLSRRPHTVPTAPALRRHRGDVAEWALAHGYVLRRDALAAIVGIRRAGGDPLRAPWTAEEVARLLGPGVAEWCAAHGVDHPEELAASLSTYLRYLSANRLLPPGSDNTSALRRAIAEHRVPDRRRSRARHPASAGRAPVLPLN
jgi:hypothetical protein